MYLEFYNVMIKSFDGGEQQIKTYFKPIKTGFKKEKKVHKDISISLKEAQYKAYRSEKSSASRAKSSVYELARNNASYFNYFITLTFDPQQVDSFDYEQVTKKITNWLNSLKKKKKDLRYIGVPERHKSGRYHFHFLMSRELEEYLYPSGHYTKHEQAIYNIISYSWGWSTATKIEDQKRVCSYICKYLTKDLVRHLKGKKRYWHSKNLKRPKIENKMLSFLELELAKETLKDTAGYHKTLIAEKDNEIIQKIDIFEI